MTGEAVIAGAAGAVEAANRSLLKRRLTAIADELTELTQAGKVNNMAVMVQLDRAAGIIRASAAELAGRLVVDDSPQAAFEHAMIDVANAKDGAGLPVNLYHGNWTADSLREATREWARMGIEKDTMWLSGFSVENAGAVASLPLSAAAEAAYWENLALLTRATAAAIRAGR